VELHVTYLQSKVISELSPVYYDYPILDTDYVDAPWMELYDINFLNGISGNFTEFLVGSEEEGILFYAHQKKIGRTGRLSM
jgi:hypothetical protein